MPFRDGTGPFGQGPRSGRGAGPTVPRSSNCMGRGFGGGGRGRRHRFGAPGTTETSAANARATVTDNGEIAVLKGQADSLQSALNEMRNRIEALEVKE